MKELKLEDGSVVKPYLDLADYEGYNSNFVTMMMWKHEYHVEYEIHDHFMVMLHNYKGMRFWAMPFTSPEFYREAIDYMIQYSHEHNFEFIIDGAIESFVENIRPLYHDQLLFERTPYNDDYIYDRQMLQTLSGKKMQKRRNHYNAFLKEHPDYIYRDLDLVKDFDIILECLNRWEYEKDGLSESMTSEVKGIMYLLSSQHLLDFQVGGIFIDGQMEAFIIASCLNHSTIQIHVEKANKEIRGLYPAILKEMLEHHFPDEKYINREEDMGLENLRRSKQSLHPVKMVHKYRIYEKDFQIMQAEDEDKDEIISVWEDNFADETKESTQYYFDALYQPLYTYVLKNRGMLISVMQIVPMIVQESQKKKNAYFILGVCTKKNFERQGCMKFLLQNVLHQYQDELIYLQAYIPEIYIPFGFYASHYLQKIVVDKSKLLSQQIEPIQDFCLLKSYYEAYTSQFDEYRVRDDNYWKCFIKRCQSFHQHILVFENHGYLVYEQDEHTLTIHEIIYLTQESLLLMLSYFQDVSQEMILICDLTVDGIGQSETFIEMMSNKISHHQFDKKKFMNEIY